MADKKKDALPDGWARRNIKLEEKTSTMPDGTVKTWKGTLTENDREWVMKQTGVSCGTRGRPRHNGARFLWLEGPEEDLDNAQRLAEELIEFNGAEGVIHLNSTLFIRRVLDPTGMT